jgi:phosphatidylglycerophosphate synthase
MRSIPSVRLADVLTAARAVAAPIVIWLIVIEERDAAYYLFAFGAITDYLDGYFARRSKKTASYGEVYDGLADFFLVYGTIITLMVKGEAYWFGGLSLFFLVWAVPVVGLISRSRGKFTIIHLDTNLLAAVFFPTVMAYIIAWQYAWVLLIVFLIVGLGTGINYSLHVRASFKQAA